MNGVATLRPPETASCQSPADEPLYEVVNGIRVEKPPMSAISGLIASRLHRRLGAHADERRLGEVVQEMLFELPIPVDRQRRPDLAFVSYERWPADRPIPDTDPWPVVPDLAVEVGSPNDRLTTVLAKVREYFDAGVRQVWVIVPSEAVIYTYVSPTQNRVLVPGDVLEGGDVLPGFSIPVADVLLLGTAARTPNA